MKIATLSLVSAFVLVSASAFADDSSNRSMDSGMQRQNMEQKSGNMTDAQIIKVVQTNNENEIAVSKVEKSQGKIDQAKKLAETVIKQNESSNKDLSKLASKINVKPEETSVSKQSAEEAKTLNNDLSAMSGRALDRAYVEKQVQMNQTKLDQLDNQLIPQAQNEALKAQLETIRAKIAQNLQVAKAVQSTVQKS